MNQIPLLNQVLLWERRHQIEKERQRILHGRKYEDQSIDTVLPEGVCGNMGQLKEYVAVNDNFHIGGSVRGHGQKI